TFSPGSRLLASGSEDSTILTWDWERACELSPLDGPPEKAWAELGNADARRAWPALLRLSRPDALPLLARRLGPVTPAAWSALCAAVKRLDADDFGTRERAMNHLAEARADALLLIYEALASRPSVEADWRLRKLQSMPRPRLGRPTCCVVCGPWRPWSGWARP